MVAKPSGASGGEGLVDGGFVEGEGGEGGLVVNWAGVHGLDEFHDGEGDVGGAI